VVNALHQVVKYDWRGSLDRNVYAPAPPLATEMEAAGWKLVYTDAENEYERPTTPRRNRSRFWSKTS
jgi:hypothetical protein